MNSQLIKTISIIEKKQYDYDYFSTEVKKKKKNEKAGNKKK